jgi:amidohydrolase
VKGPGLLQEANALHDRLVAWRRDVHMHPEPGLREWRTAGLVAAELERLGYQVRTGIAETGVVAAMLGPRPGLVVLLRFDMDCLELQEANDVPYRSRHDGLMHACGHDGHVAIGLGVATLLARHRLEFSGTVKLMFQPGEERLNGADLMIADGALEDPRPDIALAAHLWNDEPLGRVGVTAGPVMAAAASWECHIRGRGGHGAMPHQTADPIVAAAQVILAWQTIVSRNVAPLEAAVVSVGSIHGGDAFNIIPGEVTLGGTIRSFDAEAMDAIRRRFEEIAVQVSAALGCTAEVSLKPLTPVLFNDPEVTATVRRVAAGLVGEDNLSAVRVMGSEDMSFVNAQIPGCFVFVGSRNEDAGLAHPHHSPHFDFDEGALPVAVALLVAAALEYLAPGMTA